ncbi:endonuclease/exonuclease/phosphatase family protein [Devriesea agamarum]|uniref:endonuclease/exonuclease/phosphatase family protein n=1 Tax=Devriesea agamarum TaxID=472569 RepID=UPI001E530A86|nr:endonuclease/exonuclease/phosphatase family protein [Devriesea agamarum]
MRVVSWNIRDLRDDSAAVRDVINDLAPDLLMLQEAPRLLAPRARLRWLARSTNLDIALAGGWHWGLAILTSASLRDAVQARSLTPEPLNWGDVSTLYLRATAAVRLMIPGVGPLVAATTHFSLHEHVRLAHAHRIRGWASGCGMPVILGGDFNEAVDGPALRLLAGEGMPQTDSAGLFDPDCSGQGDPLAPACTLRDPLDGNDPKMWTYPALGPVRRIDALLVTPSIPVVHAQVVRSTPSVTVERLQTASDHLPTLLDIAAS